MKQFFLLSECWLKASLCLSAAILIATCKPRPRSAPVELIAYNETLTEILSDLQQQYGLEWIILDGGPIASARATVTIHAATLEEACRRLLDTVSFTYPLTYVFKKGMLCIRR